MKRKLFAGLVAKCIETFNVPKSNRNILGLVVFLLCFFGSAQAQVSSYTFSQSSGTYTAISGGTAHTTVQADDDNYSFTLPFSFNYNGTGYTVARPTTNGFLVLGGNAPSTTQYTPLSSGSTNFAISAFSHDLRSIVRSEVLGTAPNRIYVCQWSSIDRWASSAWQVDAGNVQIRLYETTNVVQIIYGSTTGTATSSTVQVGLRGAANTDFNNRTSSTNWNSTTAGGSNVATITYSSTIKPSSGLTFTWSPAACSGVPTGLTSTSITTTTATINWAAPSSAPANGYEYYYSTSNTTPTAAQTPSGTTGAGVTTANISLLSAATTYYYWVRSNCNGTDKSVWSAVGSFTTACIAPNAPSAVVTSSITSTTLTVGFSPASPVPSGYMLFMSTTTTALPTLTNGTSYMAGNNYTIGGNVYRCVASYGTATSYNLTGGIPNTQHNYFVFSANTTNSCFNAPWYSSGVSGYAITCPAVASSLTNSTTSNSATVSWSPPATGGSALPIKYRFELYSDALRTVAVSGYPLADTTSPTNISGLSSGTTYYYRIITYTTSCSSPNLDGSFTTPCAVVATFPFNETFASYLPNCWAEGDAGTSLVTGPAAVSTVASTSDWVEDGFLNSGTTGAAKMNIDSNNGAEWLITPPIAIPATGTYRVKYNVGATQYNASTAPTTAWESDDFVELLVNTTGFTNWTVLKTYNSTNVPSHLGQLDETLLSAYSGQTVRFAFRAFEGSSNGSADIDFFIDNFVVEAIPTDAVDYANIQFPGVSTTTTGTSVEIFGQAYEPGVTDPAGAATGLVVWYSKNATDVDPSSAGWTGTWTLATFNTNVGNNDEWKGAITPIPGQADTYYSFRYQLNGGPMRYGGYSGTGGGFWNGTTNKNGKLSINYEVYTTAVAPNNTVNNTIDVYLRDFDGVTNFYTDLQTSIWMYAGVQVSPSSQFQYIGTTSQDFANTSTLVEFVRQSTNPNVYKATIKFADYFCIPAATSVEGINLLFRNQYSNAGNDKTVDLFLDLTDATVTVTAPALTATTAITTTTATINWAAPTTGAVKGYDYYYSTSNTAPTAGTTPSGSTLGGVTTANLTSLLSTTNYYVWVRTKGCGSSVSAWSTMGSFTTACGTITVFPFTETFETSSTTRNCWTQIQEVGSYSWTYATGAGAATITSAHGGTLNARFVSITGTASAITKLVSPVMNLTTVTNPVLGFWYGQELWTGQQNTLKIYYRVNSSSPWIQLAHYTGNVNAWTEIENLVLPNPSAAYQIAFEGINNYGRANVVDDVTVKAAPIPTTYTWNGSSSTSWDTAVNWTPNGIPGSTDHIIVTGTSVPNKLNIVTNKTVTNFELTGSDATSFSLTGTNSLTIKGTVAYTGPATAVLNCNSTVIINNASNQIIPPLTYGNLNALGGNRIFSPTGTIKICSAFSVNPSLYSYVVTGSTVEYFSSDTGWTMVPFSYNNLTFSGTGDFTLEDGTINVAGNFVQSAGTLYLGYLDDATLAITGTMTLGNGVINSRDAFDAKINVGGDLNILNGGSLLSYSNNGTDTVIVTGNANISGTGSWSIWSDVSSAVIIGGNLVVSGTSTAAIEIDGVSGVIVNGHFSQSNTSRIYLTDGGTTVFDVAGNFTLADTSVFDLNVSSGGNSTVNLKGNLTVSTGATLTAGNANSANFNFTGTTNQIVSGAGTIAIFRSTIDKSFGYVDLQRDLQIRRVLTMNSGNIVTNSNTLTLGQGAGNPGTLTYGYGFVVGKMTRWFATGATTGSNGLFPLGTATNENRFATINFASVTTAGSLTAEVVETAMGAFSPVTVAAAGSCPLFEAKTGDTFYWKLTNNAIVATNYTAAFRKQTATATPLCSLTLLNRNPTNWLGTGTHIAPSGTTADYTLSRSGLTTYGDFGIGIKGLCGTTKTWASGAWTGGDGFAPTLTDAVIFAGNYDTTQTTPVLPNVSSCECTINPGATVTIGGGKTLTVEYGLKLSDNSTPDPLDDGKLVILNNGSLVQVADVDNATANNNTGSISMERITKPMYRYDFTYWSSPMFANNNSSDDATNPAEFSLKELSPTTLFDKYYKWNHAAATPAWQTIPVGAESMVPGRGYIVRAPQSGPYGTDPNASSSYHTYTANFIGIPNNGTVRHDVSGPDKWNLLGNPYPSAISADAFFNANVGPGIGSTNTLEGSLYLWTHNSEITEGGTTGIYSYSNGDYACYNGTGSTNTKEASSDDDPADNKPTGFIAAGQSFFVKGTATGAAVFNNSMRIAANNSQFFRPASTEPITNWDMTGKHRVWLNMKGQTVGFNQLLVGYVENATNDWDIRFDGISFGGNQVAFYSLLESRNLAIQGRALPFNNQDEVPLGYKSTLNGTLTISIDEYDGLFEGQGIYLEDKLLHVVHDLKASAYSFTTLVGTFNDRFVLRYLPSEELGNPDHESAANGLVVYQEEGRIMIKSQLQALEQVTIYDLLGRTVFDKAGIGQNSFSIQNVIMNEQPLIVKVKLANGQIVNKKIVY